MTAPFDDILEGLKKGLKGRFKDITVIVFGSVARGEATEASDLDLCVVCPPKSKKAISNLILDLEKKYKTNIQTVFTDASFTGMDHTFLETVLREGHVLVGEFPNITTEKLRLEPYRLIRYDIKKLNQSDKMRIRRILYGTKTKKRYNDRVYENRTKGLIETKNGLRTGIASILVPETEARFVEKMLKENGAIVRAINLWLSHV